ncbi:MAG: GNAT family N-acetyltransferase [Chitinophagales bacterium]
MLRFVCKPFAALTVSELYDVLRLRQEVFIVEQNCVYLDADGKDLKAHHLLGYHNNELAAYARLLPKGGSYANEASIGRVITSAKYRRHGYGKELMREAVIQMQQLYGNGPIRIGAQAYLKNFYEGFGFVDLNEPYLEDGIPHLIMLRS